MANIEEYRGKRITVTGVFDRYGATTASGVTVLIQNVELDGESLLDHTWVQQAENFYQYDIKRGERVQFSAVVLTYKKKLPLVTEYGTMYEVCYGIQRPNGIVLLDRPDDETRCKATEPYLLLPNLKTKEAGPEANTVDPLPVPEPRTMPKTRFENVSKVQGLADELGGYDELQRLLDFLKG